MAKVSAKTAAPKGKTATPAKTKKASSSDELEKTAEEILKKITKPRYAQTTSGRHRMVHRELPAR